MDWSETIICNGELMSKILEIKNLTIACSKIDNKDQNIFLQFFRDKKKSYTLLRDVSLSVFEGEYLGLVGESGCGKSLTMKSIFGMIDIDPGIVSGHISINENDQENHINILDTSKRNIMKTMFASTYFSFNHIEIIDLTVTIPSIYKLDTHLTVFL